MKDLKKLLFANRGIMQILNVQIIYFFLFVAFVCIAFPAELLNTKLGNVFLLGCSLFWLLRTLSALHFPMQNFSKIFPKTSSVVISPVISPR